MLIDVSSREGASPINLVEWLVNGRFVSILEQSDRGN